MTELRLLVLLLTAAPAVAEAQTLRGTVVEERDRAKIAGAALELITREGGTAGRTTSDSAGDFVLRASRAGVFRLHVSHPSYALVSTDSIALGPGENLAVELRMGRRAIPLEPLVVTARSQARSGGFYDRLRQPGFGRFITRADIEARPAAIRTTDLMRGVPGVEIVPVRRGRGGSTVNMIMTRGGAGRCEPTIVLDGAPIRQLPESGIDDFLKPAMLDGVEIYTSTAGAPPHLQVSSNSCGLIAFWTRTGTSEGGKPSWKKIAAGAAAVVVMLLVITVGGS